MRVRLSQHFAARRARLWLSLALCLSLAGSGCFERAEGETFYGKVAAPAAQEFRWSDGGLPRVFDPARAAAPPDTDAVRALFEGLTEYAPGSVKPAPAVASRWETADGGRTWVFHLRRGARWSNGDAVTAHDFVRSWQRTIRMGERAPHAKLLANVRGAQVPRPPEVVTRIEAATPAPSPGASPAGDAAAGAARDARPAPPAPPPTPFGAVAVDSHTLRVTLERPDHNFPALVAHPVFRPVHELSPGADLGALQDEQVNRGGGGELGVVTNGPFGLARLGGDSVVLERAPNYWDVTSVRLERVYFVNRPDPEEAINAYRAGEVDAVTNAAVEPLAVKLLTPYRDFRRETFAALNYYRFNTARPPFDDRRVREALALALDLERLSRDTLGGATEPATKFLPFEAEEAEAPSEEASAAEEEVAAAAPAGEAESPDGAGEESGAEAGGGPEGAADASREAGGAEETGAGAGREAERKEPLRQNVERARKLLAEAGYPGGENFPRVRLLVNRNEQQRLIANAVAQMWRSALGVETEIILRGWEEYELMLRAGDFDVARRSLVMQTTDEATNLLALFGDEAHPAETPAPAASPAAEGAAASPSPSAPAPPPAAAQATPILTEARALGELPAIPIYFASSYALVKPYVKGFESNLLDAPSLKHVHIDTGWRDPRPKPKTSLIPEFLR